MLLQSHHRFEDEALSDAEMKELQLLNQEREVRNVNRIEALIELPQKHGAAIQTMMNELNKKTMRSFKRNKAGVK